MEDILGEYIWRLHLEDIPGGYYTRRIPQRIYSEDTPGKYTWRIYSEDIPRGYTRKIYLEDVPGGYTWKIYQEDTLRGYTRRIHLEDIPRGFTWRYTQRIYPEEYFWCRESGRHVAADWAQHFIICF